MEEEHDFSGFLAKHGLPGLINLHKIDDAEKYRGAMRQGHKRISDHISSAFNGQHMPATDDSVHHETIDKWLENGGIDGDLQQEIYDQHHPEQAFAEGGEVHHETHHRHHEAKPLHNPVLADAYPEHNLALQESKGRIWLCRSLKVGSLII
jgi:hypothetical protein